MTQLQEVEEDIKYEFQKGFETTIKVINSPELYAQFKIPVTVNKSLIVMDLYLEDETDIIAALIIAMRAKVFIFCNPKFDSEQFSPVAKIINEIKPSLACQQEEFELLKKKSPISYEEKYTIDQVDEKYDDEYQQLDITQPGMFNDPKADEADEEQDFVSFIVSNSPSFVKNAWYGVILLASLKASKILDGDIAKRRKERMERKERIESKRNDVRKEKNQKKDSDSDDKADKKVEKTQYREKKEDKKPYRKHNETKRLETEHQRDVADEYEIKFDEPEREKPKMQSHVKEEKKVLRERREDDYSIENLMRRLDDGEDKALFIMNQKKTLTLSDVCNLLDQSKVKDISSLDDMRLFKVTLKGRIDIDDLKEKHKINCLIIHRQHE